MEWGWEWRVEEGVWGWGCALSWAPEGRLGVEALGSLEEVILAFDG